MSRRLKLAGAAVLLVVASCGCCVVGGMWSAVDSADAAAAERHAIDAARRACAEPRVFRLRAGGSRTSSRDWECVAAETVAAEAARAAAAAEAETERMAATAEAERAREAEATARAASIAAARSACMSPSVFRLRRRSAGDGAALDDPALGRWEVLDDTAPESWECVSPETLAAEERAEHRLTRIEDVPEWTSLTEGIEHEIVYTAALLTAAVMISGSWPTTVDGAEVFGPIFGDVLASDEFERHRYETDELPAARERALHDYYLLRAQAGLVTPACLLHAYDFDDESFLLACDLAVLWGGGRMRRVEFEDDAAEWNIHVPEEEAEAWRAAAGDNGDLYMEIVFHIVRVEHDDESSGTLHARVDGAIVQNDDTGTVLFRDIPSRLPPLHGRVPGATR